MRGNTGLFEFGHEKAMINISIMANDSYERVKSLEFVVEEISIYKYGVERSANRAFAIIRSLYLIAFRFAPYLFETGENPTKVAPQGS